VVTPTGVICRNEPTHYTLGRSSLRGTSPNERFKICYTARVKIPQFPLSTTDWSSVPATEHLGEAGVATWRTLTFGDIRVRMVEYSPGYLADHWCSKGHVLLCMEGELETELADGRSFTLRPGMSYQVGDGDLPHRSATKMGAKLFVVD
jgi:hypothetical protein